MNEMFSQGGKGSTGILTNKQAIARKFGVKQNEVVYFAVGVDLGGYKVIYDKTTQRAYSLPVLPVGTTAVSLSKQAVLVHSGGSVDLGELAATRGEFVHLSDSFVTGLVVNTRNEILMHNGIWYTYLGELPVTITPETNPVGSTDWKLQTDPNLRGDLNSTSLPGTSLVRHSSGNTVEAELDKLSSSAPTTRIYKDFVFDKPLLFSGYDTALATIGGTYLMPQGFDISEDNLIFVNMVSSLVGPTLRAIVVYNMEGVELTWFYIQDSGLQSLSVTGSLPNIKLYDGGRGVSGYLQEYTLTALPAAGSTVSNRVSTGVTGLTSLFCVRNGHVACFSGAARIGLFTNDDSVITIRSLSTGDVKSTIQVSRMVVGFTVGSMYGIALGPDYQTRCWKLQGIAFAKNGNILLSVGAYWETGNSQTKAAPNLGVIELNVQGEIIRHSVVNNQAFRDWLDSKGHDSSRTENEGLAVDADGNVFALYLGQFLPNDGAPTLFLSKEFASSGFDVSKYYSLYRPLSQRDLENPIRASNGRYENPILHAPFVDSPDLLRYMVLMNVRKFAWFSQIEPQLTFTGVPWNGMQKCELWNMNNGSFILTNTSTVEGFSNFRIDYDLVAHTYTVTKIRIKTNAVHTDGIVTDGGNTMTLDQRYWYPATAGSLTLGTAAKPFAELYVQTAPIVTSDRRAKFDEAEIDDVEKLLARDLVKLIKRYRLKTSKDKLHFGVIAQEVEAAFAAHNLSAGDYSVVETDDDGNLAVNYTELMLLIISSM